MVLTITRCCELGHKRSNKNTPKIRQILYLSEVADSLSGNYTLCISGTTHSLMLQNCGDAEQFVVYVCASV